jgi:hypothetical protein
MVGRQSMTPIQRGSASKSFETVFQEQYPQLVNDRLWKFFLSTYLTSDLGDLDKISALLYNEGEVFGRAIDKAMQGNYFLLFQVDTHNLRYRITQKKYKAM